jgi:hypothetical protein
MLEALGSLTAYSFVSRQQDHQFYDMHRLVHLATRNWLGNEGLLTHWRDQVLARMASIFPDAEPGNRDLWRTYLPHARFVLDETGMEKVDQHVLQLLNRYGLCLIRDGRQAEAEAPFARLTEVKKKRSWGTSIPTPWQVWLILRGHTMVRDGGQILSRSGSKC